MRRELDRLASSPFDVVIVGGGVLGAFAAWDAATRGLAVALVERADIGSGASASTLGILHGGLRYLQRLDIPRVHRSIAERSTWMRMASHLTAPLPVLVPTESPQYRHLLHAAVRCSDLIGYSRNRSLPPEQHLASGRIVSRADLRHHFPDADPSRATGGVLFVDGQLIRPERAVLGVVAAAAAKGAAIGNYVHVHGGLMRGGTLIGVRARDTISGEPLEIRGRVVLNAAGAAAPHIAELLGVGRDRSGLAYAVGFNLTLDRPPPRCALAIAQSGSDFGKRYFLVPWRGRAVLGTAHYARDPRSSQPLVTAEAVERFLTEVNAAWPGEPFRPEEVLRVHAGFVPCSTAPPTLRPLDRHRIIDHTRDGLPTLVTAVTEKLTTARFAAERAIDRVCRRLDRTAPPCRTHQLRLPGAPTSPAALRASARERLGDLCDEAFTERLVGTYGTEYERVLAHRQTTAGWDLPDVPDASVIAAQFVHGIREELAVTPADLLTRRTEVGLGQPASPEVEQLAQRAIAECT